MANLHKIGFIIHLHIANPVTYSIAINFLTLQGISNGKIKKLKLRAETVINKNLLIVTIPFCVMQIPATNYKRYLYEPKNWVFGSPLCKITTSTTITDTAVTKSDHNGRTFTILLTLNADSTESMEVFVFGSSNSILNITQSADILASRWTSGTDTQAVYINYILLFIIRCKNDSYT